MKASKEPRNSGLGWTITRFASGMVLVGLIQSAVQAQETNAAALPSTGTPTASASEGTTAAESANSPESTASRYSSGVQTLLTLAEAKVSRDVMLKFVQTSSQVTYPTASELVAMKTHNVPDEVIVAFMDRGAAIEIETRSSESRRTIAVPSIVSALSTEGEMDPDSYEFWWYHYAYPRALSFSYKMLSPHLPGAYGNYGNVSYPYGNLSYPYANVSYPNYASYSVVQPFPYSSRYAKGRPPLTSSRVQYGTLPPTSGRHNSFSVPSATVNIRRQGSR